tara:strand:+ start:2183 stop:3601 length:1419 start_codon:yes stop_codon:yes gene_type:complete
MTVNIDKKYEAGFSTDVETDLLPKGLNEDIVTRISAKMEEPEWLLKWRLNAYRRLQAMEQPKWADPKVPDIDLQDIIYFAQPKKKYDSLDDVPQEILDTYNKLGVPIGEQAKLAGVAVDAVFDSVSVGTTFKDDLEKQGIIFCPFSEAVKRVPDIVKKYLGTVIPQHDNFWACLNSAVFTNGSFVYIPKGVRCPLELSTYFRINAEETGQFERTLIICEDDGYISYLEGCTAPMRDQNQLHAAVVELVALENAEIKYSTVQNWYPGDEEGNGGIYNFVTKRGLCFGNKSKISWTQLETGSAITWKYPSCVLQGDDSVGEFYSVAVTNNVQEADTGTKMIHMGKNTKSTIISKGISAKGSRQTYRGLVKVLPGASNARNFTQCDSLLLNEESVANTIPYIEVENDTSIVEHEATTSNLSDEQKYYLMQRGLSEEDAVNVLVSGFAKEVTKNLPLEFAAEANALLKVSMEGSVG